MRLERKCFNVKQIWEALRDDMVLSEVNEYRYTHEVCCKCGLLLLCVRDIFSIFKTNINLLINIFDL